MVFEDDVGSRCVDDTRITRIRMFTGVVVSLLLNGYCQLVFLQKLK